MGSAHGLDGAGCVGGHLEQADATAAERGQAHPQIPRDAVSDDGHDSIVVSQDHTRSLVLTGLSGGAYHRLE